MRRHVVVVIAATLLPLTLGGCAGVLVIGGLAGAGTAGYAAGQERGLNGTVDDIAIKSRVQVALGQAIPPLPPGLDVTVYQGRALLTGRVPSPQVKEEAREVTSRVAGVRNVFDETEIGSPEVAWDVARDAWITARLRSELVLEPQIRSMNYVIETSNHAVYLIGSARTQGELDRATQIARYVPDVSRVVSYVEIRPGAAIASQPVPPPAPPVSGNPVAAPRAPVEVQKL
ncbi:MAG: BON domain-containing protein [Alphaproteobacteria bacterium]|nr:BON domain-containing protein [Alphaproteobacteria bacterium]